MDCNRITSQPSCEKKRQCSFSGNVLKNGKKGWCLNEDQVRATMPDLDRDPQEYYEWVDDVLLGDGGDGAMAGAEDGLG